MTKIVLENDCLQIGILPQSGACLSFMQYKKNGEFTNILRPLDLHQKNEALHSSLFPMIPFCFRIQGGEFTYWGITRRMKKNKAGESNPIYGDGWENAWKIEEKSSDKVVLKLAHDKKDGGYPFSYTAVVVYQLIDHALDISLKIKNESVLPMPCGMGIRPFFKKTPEVIVKFKAQDVWSNGKDSILGRPYAVPGHWDFSEGKPLEKKVFETCFGGFDGQAEIVYPEEGIKVAMQCDEQFRHIALETPGRKNYFCLSPATNTDDAFNLAFSGVVGTGIKSIGPFEEATSHITMTVKG